MLRKILAVDDSALIHQMYKLFLSRYKNCKLVSAMNGLEALDKLGQEEEIDLILLDINMPVMNGLEFLQRVQKESAYKDDPGHHHLHRGQGGGHGPGSQDGGQGLRQEALPGLGAPQPHREDHRHREPRRRPPGPLMDFEVSAELVGIYLEDAREHLAALDDALLRLERDGPDPDVAASLLGPLHTLKGNSGMIGLIGVKDYVHRLEDAFTRVRDGSLALTSAVLQRLFEGASALREAVEAAGLRRRPRDLAAEKAVLDSLLVAGASPTEAPARRPSPSRRRRAAAGAGPRRPHPVRSSLVRVDFAKLDLLLNLVGELIVHRTKLTELGRQVAAVAPEAGQELTDSVHQVASVSTQLQETIMDIRMLPIRHVFERFPRLVRDLAHDGGKQVELILQGEDTRVDKAVIDEIGEPLVHLIRNAVDHGIEPPEVRRARGQVRPPAPSSSPPPRSPARSSSPSSTTGRASTPPRCAAARSSGGS